jgi:hypothetical protein
MRNQTKGKKKDLDYLNNFISDCIINNVVSLEDMISAAKQQISEIDQKIIEVENLKKTRCKLLTVVSVLDKNKLINQDFSKILPLFNINNHYLCQKILYDIKQKPINIASLSIDNIDKQDIISCIKELSEGKVIYINDQHIYAGENFDNFLKFVLREA